LRAGLVTVTASVGVALCEASDLARADEDDHVAWTDAEALLQAADTAMFAAKVKGPGRYEVYSDALHSQARERLELTEALRRALPAGDLLLHYQPLADLDTGAVVGLEALTRLQLPDGAVRPAADFIDLAEDIGLIVEIDRWALATAAEQAAAWARAGHPLPRLAVNASASRLADPRLVTDVVAALARVPESFELCLEITEHAIMDRRDHVIPVLRQLHDLGARQPPHQHVRRRQSVAMNADVRHPLTCYRTHVPHICLSAASGLCGDLAVAAGRVRVPGGAGSSF
jgi:predicted signal transduction protein with EAL and GGDEF domain